MLLWYGMGGNAGYQGMIGLTKVVEGTKLDVKDASKGTFLRLL